MRSTNVYSVALYVSVSRTSSSNNNNVHLVGEIV